ncbi:hypothetical protein E4U17_001992 [Claviceps sp. LM77 group G4]|nr:hypothetical protein E4U17_001992 [Claviceps sp. LM77 group G4]KAG6075892.1 hypothetical protein E4U33_001987 [Claviceps sp. LM78 group G4]KAG6077181.1 hypothetical protein E4U16_002372 [Claviceps sp. LM84 group G4]
MAVWMFDFVSVSRIGIPGRHSARRKDVDSYPLPAYVLLEEFAYPPPHLWAYDVSVEVWKMNHDEGSPE